MKKQLNTEGITNELAGASLFFAGAGQKRTAQNLVTDTPLPEQLLAISKNETLFNGENWLGKRSSELSDLLVVELASP
jgi:hypothetical protein